MEKKKFAKSEIPLYNKDIVEEKRYYAHTENTEGEFHLLKDHLVGTASLMEEMCAFQEFKPIFYMTGLLHDFGKYQDAFQRYLINGGRRGSVPHARWGAYYLGKTHVEIAFAINGHHKGLPNLANLKNDFNYSEEDRVELQKIKNQFEKDLQNKDNNTPDISKLDISELIKKDVSHRELFIRYLFSCLADADWLDTERHADKKKYGSRNTLEFNCDELLMQIEACFDSFSKEGEINVLRNQTRNFAIAKADEKIGFYSLNLPTGLGKTLTSVYWALIHAKKHSLKRLIIVLPFISIIDQTAKLLKEIFGEDLILEHHSSYEFEDDRNENSDANIQEISKYLATENWDYPIIVTTSVQFFESLFSNRTSKCRKIHNIAQSVVIFDEVQTLPKELVHPTLKMLKSVQSLLQTTFLFCTATQPAFKARINFKDGIESIEPLVENPKLLFLKTKRVKYHLLKNGDELEIKTFLKNISTKKSSLIVVNTKKTAIKLFLLLEGQLNKESLYFLSTDLCPDDRKKKIEKIRNDLKNNKKIMVVSTQLIEAGVDFDFPIVYRENAPMDSIIQAAGRCNREGKMKKKGSVFIFKLKDSGYPNMQYKNLASYCLEKIKKNIDLLHNYDTFEEYYEDVLDLYVDSDKHKISKSRESFNFEDVALSYKLIDQPTRALFIVYYNQESEEIEKEIRKRAALGLSISKSIYKKMQQFSIQAYPHFIKENSEYIEVINEELFWVGKYNQYLGIKDGLLTVNDLIVQ